LFSLLAVRYSLFAKPRTANGKRRAANVNTINSVQGFRPEETSWSGQAGNDRSDPRIAFD